MSRCRGTAPLQHPSTGVTSVSTPRSAAAFRRLGAFCGPFPLEAAERVIDDVEREDGANAVDLVARLVDKSLVTADVSTGADAQYRMLEPIQRYAVARASDASELDAARDRHLSWWVEWLEPRAALPSDDDLVEVDRYQSNLRAALEWATRDPTAGLRVLGLLARPWHSLGVYGDIMDAADRLLTETNAERLTELWLSAASELLELTLAARGPAASEGLRRQIIDVAHRAGDDYHATLARAAHDPHLADVVTALDMARASGDLYMVDLQTLNLADLLADEDPREARQPIREAARIAAASPNRILRSFADELQIAATRAAGELHHCISLATDLIADRRPPPKYRVLTELSAAGLMAGDRTALDLVVAEADRVERIAPGVAAWAVNARHRRDLLAGMPSQPHTGAIHPDSGMPTRATMWLMARETLDAGHADIAVQFTRRLAGPKPHSQAILAATEGAATGDEDRWRTALTIAAEHGLRLIVIDALEAIAVLAAADQSWRECRRLIAAAARLRQHTGYRWRFRCEEHAVATALTDSLAALGDTAALADSEGQRLEWTDAVVYASRAHGERRRPRHGWASLTPTEQQVAKLVADGLTNPQIADQLIMRPSTVKTHLDHIYVKLDTHTRARLAAEYTRRTNHPPPTTP